MTDNTERPKFIPDIDPGNVPIQTINGAQMHGFPGSQFAVTLKTLGWRQTPNGDYEAVNIIAARLRFDLEMARIIRDQLNEAINVLTAPPDVKPN